jgi:hypothetical protein
MFSHSFRISRFSPRHPIFIHTIYPFLASPIMQHNEILHHTALAHSRLMIGPQCLGDAGPVLTSLPLTTHEGGTNIASPSGRHHPTLPLPTASARWQWQQGQEKSKAHRLRCPAQSCAPACTRERDTHRGRARRATQGPPTHARQRVTRRTVGSGLRPTALGTGK